MADEPKARSLSEVRRRYEADLLSRAGVVGVAEGKRGAEDTIQVLVTRGVDVDLPDQLEGYPVEVVETGVIEAE